ncbi:MAG: amino acid ABC transporter substrate-binding protein [Victivallales bacterium]|nr:amino acid ABC transporter substrate-binding protein [Victivallales bacterium]
MKKLLAVVALALLCTFTGCAKKQSNTFTVGFDAEFPPYGFKDEKTGEYTGFDLELAEEVAKRNGWTLVKKPINWDSKDMELNSGSIDCIWNGFTINGRENEYEWTEAYVDNSQVVMVKKDSPVKTLADLAGKVVAAQTDTPVLKALQEGGDKADLGKTFKKIVISSNYVSAMMELESGAVDAVAVDIGVAKAKIADTGDKFAILDENIMSEQYGIGFKKGNTALRDKVQSTLKGMVADGAAVEISKKYFDGKDVLIIKP